MTGVRAVVLDYGEVLCTEQPIYERMVIEQLCGVADESARERLWHAYRAERDAYDRGTVDTAGYWGRVTAAAGLPAPDNDQVARLAATDVAGWSYPDEAVHAWAHTLRQAGVRLGLLSNAFPELRDHLQAAPWTRVFDAMVFSCELGLLKPEAEIYEHCLAQLGVQPAETLFVDDRQVNADGARAAGLHAVTFTGAPALAAELARSWPGLPGPPVG